ncbi:MAG: 50S ribosomal protein L18 [Alphaproteobacteria bacterium]|nr:50S ribosomal protein L18 [Alphaproteobacteria bacterium]
MTKNLFDRRKARARYKISQSANGRPRLSVYRSGKHIYAQIIDDAMGATLVTASTHEKGGAASKSYNVAAAAEVGKKIAERAKGKGLTQVVFDRGGYIYHGRIKALAEAAREGGLEF